MQMSTTMDYKKAIVKQLGNLEKMLEGYSEISQYDENLAMEDVICKLLNLAYGYELENLNRERPNHPAVDLGDRKRGIAVQVTSTNDRRKIEHTLETFDSEGLGVTYHRVIVFVLGSRGNFKKKFSSASVNFSPKEDLMDFSTLMKRIGTCDPDEAKAIYDYLEYEYPSAPKDTKWIKWMCIAVSALLLILIVWNVGVYLREEYLRSHPKYEYETEMDWLTMAEAAAVLGAKSRVEVYSDHLYEGSFYEGIALTVLYNNLDEQDRILDTFSVYVEDIVEDLSPLLYHIAYEEVTDGFVHELKNWGWGETGEIRIDFVSLTPDGEYAEESDVKVTLREDALRSWTLDSIHPGERKRFDLLEEDDFCVEFPDEQVGAVTYVLRYELYAPESDYRLTIPCWLTVTPDGISQDAGGWGDGDETCYVVWVPTSAPTWSQTYEVQQILPGKKTVRLPIFITPEKSCTMTVRIEFETADGEIISADPLENVSFTVPYYEDYNEYIDGMLLDWDLLNGSEVIYFPFAATNRVLPEG